MVVKSGKRDLGRFAHAISQIQVAGGHGQGLCVLASTTTTSSNLVSGFSGELPSSSLVGMGTLAPSVPSSSCAGSWQGSSAVLYDPLWASISTI